MWLPATPGWGPLVLLGGGPLPLLAEDHCFLGRGVGGWPCFWLWVLGGRSLATPDRGVPLVLVVGGLSPLLAEGFGCGSPPLLGGSAGRGGGRFCVVGWGLGAGFPVLCLLVARRMRVVSVLVCVLCVRGGSVGVGVSTVRVGVRVRACVVCGGWFPRLGLAAGSGPPSLLAGVRRLRRWPFPWGWVRGFRLCVCLLRGVCAWCLCWCVCRVFLVFLVHGGCPPASITQKRPNHRQVSVHGEPKFIEGQQPYVQ